MKRNITSLLLVSAGLFGAVGVVGCGEAGAPSGTQGPSGASDEASLAPTTVPEHLPPLSTFELLRFVGQPNKGFGEQTAQGRTFYNNIFDVTGISGTHYAYLYANIKYRFDPKQLDLSLQKNAAYGGESSGWEAAWAVEPSTESKATPLKYKTVQKEGTTYVQVNHSLGKNALSASGYPINVGGGKEIAASTWDMSVFSHKSGTVVSWEMLALVPKQSGARTFAAQADPSGMIGSFEPDEIPLWMPIDKKATSAKFTTSIAVYYRYRLNGSKASWSDDTQMVNDIFKFKATQPGKGMASAVTLTASTVTCTRPEAFAVCDVTLSIPATVLSKQSLMGEWKLYVSRTDKTQGLGCRETAYGNPDSANNGAINADNCYDTLSDVALSATAK